MIKNFFALCFLFLSFQLFSQNVDLIKSTIRLSNDEELSTYVARAKSNGLSLNDAEELANVNGASIVEIQKLRKLWNNQSVSSTNTNIFSDSINSSIGSTQITKIIPLISNRFGASFFENDNISEVPQMFVATPTDYRLGPGDELIINLYGASENTYSVQISRNGTIKFDRIAPVYLSGLSIKSAKNRLKNSLSKIYAGLLSNDKLSKVDIDLSLKKARSVIINITGHVTAPGTYTVSGFSSILNALYAAGGPNETGSYRNIKLLRNGKVNTTIDLYDYFISGKYPSVFLRDQDVILVEAYKKQVNIKSGFKTTGLFEIKEQEKLSDLIKFSGGFLSDSYKDKIFINRINLYSRSLREVNSENFEKSELKDGDLISAKTVKNFVGNTVSVEGAVYLPGLYDLSNLNTVKDLIESSKGTTPDAITKALIFRTNNGVQDELISIDLKNKKDLQQLLMEGDNLFIESSSNLNSNDQIIVEGEVNAPNRFNYKKGMTVRDALIMASGFNSFANKSNVILIRNISDENLEVKSKSFVLSFDKNYNSVDNIKMLPNDIISVRRKSYLKESQSFKVEGEVAIPGYYSIEKDNYSIKDAFLDHIELLKTSSFNGIYVLRDDVKIPIKFSRDNTNKLSPISNLELKSEDIIYVPVNDNTIFITGGVQKETIIVYDKSISFKNAVFSAGGYIENADVKRSYIEYQNGLKKSVQNFIFFKSYPKVEPGSKIVIPLKSADNRKKISLAEIVGYTTSLVSIVAILKSF
jgi:protein involved in polysaccharide export with SLBB domain